MTRLRLPIGIQTFREIREDGHYYVDKTPFIRSLLDRGKHYFLSRPRRFGKSLFLDTLKELFEGHEALFEGLAIHPHWDWSVRHPVVRLSFGSGDFTDPDYLRLHLQEELDMLEQTMGVDPRHETARGRLTWLLKTLHARTGKRAVVLVDEYDKPILDTLEIPEVAKANRDALRGLYSVIKDCDAHIRFAFLTGVSKFSKVSLFSGLNQLKDITLDPRYSAICGYTEADLDEVFAPELPGLDREAVRAWYNGYGWRGAEKVYNPFDVLLLFDTREFKAHWFETGSPTFLIDMLTRRGVNLATLEGQWFGEDLLSKFDVGDIAAEALLFQTGYLTITGVDGDDGEWVYRLDYPNREVRLNLNRRLLGRLTGDSVLEREHRLGLRAALGEADAEAVRARLHALFAGIPHHWHTRNAIADYEGYYASVMYSYFSGLGFDVRVEECTSRGRLDMAVPLAGHVWLFEFKVVEEAPTGSAMAQLRERRYADKYRARGEPVHLVAVEFGRAERNIVAFEAECA